jgi:hypothetical protein
MEYASLKMKSHNFLHFMNFVYTIYIKTAKKESVLMILIYPLSFDCVIGLLILSSSFNWVTSLLILLFSFDWKPYYWYLYLYLYFFIEKEWRQSKFKTIFLSNISLKKYLHQLLKMFYDFHITLYEEQPFLPVVKRIFRDKDVFSKLYINIFYKFEIYTMILLE